ncbi:MAG: hypothetical protein JWM78_535 [Verrucomicrobiaceae bacterium]|nr:hypothetical protein [Verrucomicrobiaceae bacterium]
MKFNLKIALVTVLALLAGCTSHPQQAVNLPDDLSTMKKTKIGVAMTPLPKVDTSFDGAGCLLCMATASLANSALTDYVRKLPTENLADLKSRIADLLKNKGFDVVLIDSPINIATLQKSKSKGPNVSEVDYSGLKNQYQVDKLLIIDINALGVLRTYSGYIPTSDPKARLKGVGYIIDLSNNTYDWYLPLDILKNAEGSWDEAPKFPGLTNAYFQAIEIGQDSFSKPFSE